MNEILDLKDSMENYKLEYAQSIRPYYKACYLSILTFPEWNATASRVGADGTLEDAVDVILCPVGPGAAPPLDCSRYWGYTSQWNLLDYPALVFPVSTVDLAVDVWDKEYVAMNEQDHYNHDLCNHSPPLLRLDFLSKNT